MASIDDLNEQLSITQKLNSIIDRMTVSLSRVEQSYATQADHIERMVKALSDFDLSKTTNEINVLTGRIKDLSGILADLGSVSDRSMDNVVKNSAKASESVKSFDQNVKNAKKGVAGMKSVNDQTFSELEQHLQDVNVSSDGFNNRLGKISEFLKGKFPRGVFIAAAALSGLYQGFENIVNVTKSTVGVITSLSSTIFNVGLAIATIPMKIFTNLVDMAASASANWMEFRQAVEDLRKEFGDLKGPTSLALTGLMHDMKGFNQTGLSAWRIFGDFAERLAHLREVATSLGATFDATRNEWIDNGGALLGFQKGLGVANEELKSIASRAIATGRPVNKVLLDMTKQTLALGDAFGISQKVIGKDMAKALNNVRHFGALTVKEIGQASVYARKLGIELDKITGTLDQFETFDGAAESAAKLAQSFGVSVDAFQLMEAQSPAEQLDMLRKGFARAGVDVSNFNRQQLRLLSSTTGLDEATAKQAFSLQNQGVSLDDIKKKSEIAEKKQLSQAEALGKLADSIERLVKQEDQTGSYFDMFVRGIGNGFQASKDFVKIIFNIKQGLQEVFYVGVELGRALPKIIPGLDKFMSSLATFFQPKKFRDLAKTVSNAIKDYFSGGKSLSSVLDDIQAKFASFFSMQSPVVMSVYDGFKRIFGAGAKAINDAIPLIAKTATKMIMTATEFIRNPKKFMQNVKTNSGQFGFLTDAIMTTVDSLKDAGKVLWPAIKEFAAVAFQKISEIISQPPISTYIEKAGKAMIVLLFGPAVARAALATFTSFLIKTTLESFASATVTSKLQGAASGLLGRIFGGGATGAGAAAVSSSVSAGLSNAATTSGGLFAKVASIPMVATAATMANNFATKLGASGVGSAIGGAVGLAAVAYIGVKGKQIIDEAFEKGRSADKSLHGADISASNALRSKSLEEKLGAIKNLQNTLLEQQDALKNKGLGEKALNWIAGTDIAADQAANSLAVAKRTLQDLQDQVNKIRKQGLNEIKPAQDSLKDKFGSLEFVNPLNIEDAAQKIKQLENLSKKLAGKDFDLQKSIQGIRDKLKNVSFTILDQTQTKDLASSIEGMSSVASNVQNVSMSFDAFKGFAKNVSDATREIKQSGLGSALKAVQEMIDQANMIDSALADGQLNTINVKTKLKQVATNLGLGSKGQYTIQSKPVQINLNLQVSINAEDMEKAIVMRAQSIIRDRLNFATSRPGERGDTTISDKTGEQPLINPTSAG